MQNISVIADRSCCARVYSAGYNMATGVFARVDLVYPVLASHESYKTGWAEVSSFSSCKPDPREEG